jgi:hypothetical protein
VLVLNKISTAVRGIFSSYHFIHNKEMSYGPKICRLL